VEHGEAANGGGAKEATGEAAEEARKEIGPGVCRAALWIGPHLTLAGSSAPSSCRTRFRLDQDKTLVASTQVKGVALVRPRGIFEKYPSPRPGVPQIHGCWSRTRTRVQHLITSGTWYRTCKIKRFCQPDEFAWLAGCIRDLKIVYLVLP